jgi:hypothetical protein
MNPVKKYCKVCHDSGKTEAEYTSHYTRESRDPNSKIICPILKSLECRYCCKSGHTVKYCPILKKKNNNYNNNNNNFKKEVSKKEEKKNPVVTNKFACLDDSDEEEIDVPNEEKEEFVCKMNYAAALKTEKKKIVEPQFKMLEDVVSSDKEEPTVLRKEPIPRGRILDWAAYCDSDSDEE